MLFSLRYPRSPCILYRRLQIIATLGRTRPMNQNTELTDYGIVQLSPNAAAALTGFSRKAITRRIVEGTLSTTGRTKKLLNVSELEALTGRPITAEAYLRHLGDMASRPVRMA